MQSIAASQCIVCGNSFPYRKSKQYCSNACKQQAYLSSKEGKSLPTYTKSEKPAYDFSVGEFTQFVEGSNHGIDLIPYCFLRRSLKPDATLEEVKAYFDALLYTGYSAWDFYNEQVRDTKAYQTFKESFLSGQFIVGP